MIASVTYNLISTLDSSILLIGSCALTALAFGYPLLLLQQRHVSQAGRWLWHLGTESMHAAEMSVPTAMQDRLTGLPGRLLLEEKLRSPSPNGGRKAVLVIGVDGFSAINQLYGHAYGDLLLKAIAERVRTSVRMEHLVARLAGDEFAIVADVEELAQAKSIAKRLMQDMQRAFVIDDDATDLSVSVGIAMETIAGGQRSRLLTQATAALEEAKDLGRNRFTVFDVQIGASAAEVELMVSDLRRALREGQFFLMYQPKLDVQSGRVVGMEALLRWDHPEHGQVPPDHFVPLAEKTGMIVDIGRWVLDEACRQMQVWQNERVIDWPVSVNASVFQINSASFCTDVLEALERNQLDPRDLCIEVTESGAMRNAELSLLTLRKLVAGGVRISLDDFGVGHSSLAHLKRFPVQELKVDRSFISCMNDCAESEAIVRAIIGLAKAVGLQVVAEGVETVEQQALLADMDCDVIQGYLISRPMYASDVPALIAKYNDADDVLHRLLKS